MDQQNAGDAGPITSNAGKQDVAENDENAAEQRPDEPGKVFPNDSQETKRNVMTTETTNELFFGPSTSGVKRRSISTKSHPNFVSYLFPTVLKRHKSSSTEDDVPDEVEEGPKLVFSKPTIPKKLHQNSEEERSDMEDSATGESTTDDESLRNVAVRKVSKVLNNLDEIEKDLQHERESKEPFTCSLYITNYNEDKKPAWLDKNLLIDAAKQVVQGRMQVEETKCGLIAVLSDPKDSQRIKDLNIAKIFKKNVQITSFVDYNPENMHVVLLLNVPWSLPISEIEFALQKQGIKVAQITRIRTFIRVVLANGFGYERLLREGLNFYRSTCFKAITERMASEMYTETDSVIQCYRCQGFWHMASRCRNIPRCVRCGDRHALEYCPRPRTHPICCHCGGDHHAADLGCPVRKELKNAVEVRIVVAKNRNTSFNNLIPTCSS